MSKRHDITNSQGRFHTASSGELHFASDDYPELEEILVERPPLEHASSVDRYSMPRRVSLGKRLPRTSRAMPFRWYLECKKCGYQSPFTEDSNDVQAESCPKCGTDDVSVYGTKAYGSRRMAFHEDEDFTRDEDREDYVAGWNSYLSGDPTPTKMSVWFITGYREASGFDMSKEWKPNYASRRTASFNRENVIWVSPDGTWNRGFFAEEATNTWSDDYDPEWDVEYDFGHFWWVSVGHPNEEAAHASWTDVNPGGGWILDDPNNPEVATYDAMAQEVISKGRRSTYDRGMTYVAGNLLSTDGTTGEEDEDGLSETLDFGGEQFTTQASTDSYSNEDYQRTIEPFGYNDHDTTDEVENAGNSTGYSTESNDSVWEADNATLGFLRRSDLTWDEYEMRDGATPTDEIDEPHMELHLPDDVHGIEGARRRAAAYGRADRMADAQLEAKAILISEGKAPSMNKTAIESALCYDCGWAGSPNEAKGDTCPVCHSTDVEWDEDLTSDSKAAKRHKTARRRPASRKTAATGCQTCGGALPFGQPYGICADCTNADRTAIPSKAFPEHLQTVNGSRKTAVWMTFDLDEDYYADNVAYVCDRCAASVPNDHKEPGKLADAIDGYGVGHRVDACMSCGERFGLLSSRASVNQQNFTPVQPDLEGDNTDAEDTSYGSYEARKQAVYRKTARNCDYCSEPHANEIAGYGDLYLCDTCEWEMNTENDMEAQYHEMYGSRKTGFVQSCPVCMEGFESDEGVFAETYSADMSTVIVCSDYCADVVEGNPPLMATADINKVAYPENEYDSCSRCGEEFWMGAQSCPYCGYGANVYDEDRLEWTTDRAEATLHDEPEAALPSTDGNMVVDDEMDPQNYDEIGDDAALASQTASRSWLMDGGSATQADSDIAHAARNHLKTALKEFSAAEQAELINEGAEIQASNLDRLQIDGTHYEYLEEQLSRADESGEDVLWW